MAECPRCGAPCKMYGANDHKYEFDPDAIIAERIAALTETDARAGGESTVVLRDPETVEATLIDVCQLLDGWHQDGTVWSTWDETVRQRAGKLLREVYDQNKARGIRSTAYSPPALPSEPSEPK